MPHNDLNFFQNLSVSESQALKDNPYHCTICFWHRLIRSLAVVSDPRRHVAWGKKGWIVRINKGSEGRFLRSQG